jgi:hypothetical protein
MTGASSTAPPEPQPWLTDEDAHGWRVRARANRAAGAVGTPPRATVEVRLDQAQSAWVRLEAERAGVTYEDVLTRLVDAARDAGEQAYATGEPAAHHAR